jgi:DNA-binding transcriptional LysR family regulator
LLGLVRIGAIETVVHTWLVDFLRHLQSSYPGIEVQLSSETTEALHKSLLAGGIDIALQTDPAVGDGIASTPCLPMAMGWVGPPGERQPGEGTLAALLQRPTITMSPGSQPHLALKELYRKAGLPVGKVHCVSSIAAIVRLVKGGFGNALMPLAPVRDAVERGELRIIASDVPLPPQRLVVSYHDHGVSEAIRFVAELACRESDRFVQSLPAPFSLG